LNNYFQDLGGSFFTIITQDPSFLTFFYFNFINNIVYNLTSFHFMIFVFEKFLDGLFAILSFLFSNKCLIIKNKILSLIAIFFVLFGKVLDHLKNSHYKEPKLFKLKTYTVMDIRKI
jgi:hypothetical protein